MALCFLSLVGVLLLAPSGIAADPGLVVPPATAAPFALLLAAVALLPLVSGHWWHANRNKAIVTAALAVPIAIYLLTIPKGGTALAHSLEEYVQFLVLLGSLYTISGGIALTGDLPAKPRTNLAFLAMGAVLANFIGTTGASMLLIRPLLRTNRDRKKTTHIPIFFILIVSNCGGLLTPLGDPPLFLGFLQGVDFFWTLRLWREWALVNGFLLFAFFCVDVWCYRRETIVAIVKEELHVHPLRLSGWQLNVPLMLGAIIAVISKKFIPLFPVCELFMLLMAGLSMRFTPRSVRDANHFAWGPILEVAVIFAGIFVTMVPALALLNQHGKQIGVTEPWQFFWLTGILSSGLDNAPTYLTMAELGTIVTGAKGIADLAVSQELILSAISCGAVFMGANSYIGNGPNFMVKAIAEEQGYKMPSFFGYVLYAAVIMLPALLMMTFLFFV